jgi:hypothetical protein
LLPSLVIPLGKVDDALDGAHFDPFQARTWLDVGVVDATGYPWRPVTSTELALPPISPESRIMPSVDIVAGEELAALIVMPFVDVEIVIFDPGIRVIEDEAMPFTEVIELVT